MDEVIRMDIKEIREQIEKEGKKGKVADTTYWPDVYDIFVQEESQHYKAMSVEDAAPMMISRINLANRKHLTGCDELGVDIRVGDICYIDYGEAYLYEIGFQHFGLILKLENKKALVVPMSGNQQAYMQAYSKDHPNGKQHLMRFGKMEGMNKRSVLFLNDVKWISTARIIDVKSHLSKESEFFKEIKERAIDCMR